MARITSRHPTELELQILKILWDRGPIAVRDVRQALAEEEGRSLAHTSVITVLNTMVEKKYLRRKAKGNAYIFEAKVGREDVSQGFVSDVVNRVFDGSAVSMMLNLLENEDISESEYEQLKQMIEQHRKQKGKS